MTFFVAIVTISFNGQPDRKANFKLSNHEIGLKFIIPMEKFDAYIGAGGLWGRATLEDLSNLTGDDKKRWAYGSYWHAGFHFLFNKHLGHKFAFQKNNIVTDEMKNLGGKNLRFNQNLYSLGFVLRFY